MKKLTKLLALFMCMSFVIMAITPSTAYAATSVGQVKIKSVKADKNYIPVVTWDTVKGADGYVVYRKDNDWYNWHKIGTTKETSFKDHSAFEDIVHTWSDYGDNYEYKYKVRAYVKNGKKVTYGKYSKTKAYKFTRYMYKNKLIALMDFETDSYSILKAELPKEFKATNARWYGNDTLIETVDTIAADIDMNDAFKETEEGQALAAEYDRLVAEADEYYNKWRDSEDGTEEYAEYRIKYNDAYEAYEEVWDKLHPDALNFTNLVASSADAYYNNLKDSKGNTITTAEDIDRIVKEKSTSDYTGWFISISGSSSYNVDDDYVDQTPNGIKVYYNNAYSMHVNVPVDSTAKGMYKEKGAKMSNHSYNAIIEFRRFENGRRVKAEDMDLGAVDEIIKGIKFTPVALVKRLH